MSESNFPQGAEQSPITLLATANEICGEWHGVGDRSEVRAADLVKLQRCALAGQVIAELLSADATNADMAGGEVLTRRQRSAFVDAIDVLFDEVLRVAQSPLPDRA